MITELNACIIYKITNLISGKCYVGQTRHSLVRRTNYHKYYALSRRGKCAIHAAIRKYGWENFKCEVLEANIVLHDLDDRERFWIAELNSMHPNGYNLLGGGQNARIVMAETRAKISAANKGRKLPPHTEEWRRKMSAIMTGRPMHPNARAAIHKALTGRKCGPHSAEWNRKISEAHKGKKLSDSHIAALILGSSRRGPRAPHSEEAKSRMSLARIGKKMGPHTEEWKRLMSIRNSGANSPRFGKRFKGTPWSEDAKLKQSERMKGIGNHRSGTTATQETRSKMSASQTEVWKKRKESLCHSL